MKRISCVVLLIMIMVTAGSIAQDVKVKLEQPILVTSCGQSPGPVRLKVFMKRLKYDFDFNLNATAEDVIAKQESGAPYRTLFIVTGASLKGMGSAGVSMKDELERTAALIAEAKKHGIMVVGTHIEGMSRRSQGAASGDNSDEQSIDAVCLKADLMFVKEDGNEDGRFTVIGRDKKIPLFTFTKNADMQSLLEKLFN